MITSNESSGSLAMISEFRSLDFLVKVCYQGGKGSDSEVDIQKS
jgi:hypothetical protein